MMTQKPNLEVVLAQLPKTVRAETIMTILQNGQRSENIKAREAKAQIPSEMLLETLEYYAATGQQEEAVSFIVKGEGVERKDYVVISRGAELS